MGIHAERSGSIKVHDQWTGQAVTALPIACHIKQPVARILPIVLPCMPSKSLYCMMCHVHCRSAAPEQQAQAAQMRAEALQLLAPFLALPADMAQRVQAAVEAIVSDVFPVFSQVASPAVHFLSE